jgi:hypothetical protein
MREMLLAKLKLRMLNKYYFFLFISFFFILSFFFISDNSVAEDLGENSSADSTEDVDPRAGRYFIVTANLSFENSVIHSNSSAFNSVSRKPSGSTRGLILTKYNTAEKRPRGWGIALTNFNTSLRFEVYWKGEKGGGWYTFNHVTLEPKSSYKITLLALPGEYIKLYLENDDEVQPLFLGGYDVSKTGIPQSSSRLITGDGKTGRHSFRGKVSQIFIAERSQSKSIDDFHSSQFDPSEIRLSITD